MNFLRTALAELLGLFIEDGSFTLGIIVAVAVAIFVLPHTAIRPEWRGATLFVALTLVLLENIHRSVRKHPRSL